MLLKLKLERGLHFLTGIHFLFILSSLTLLGHVLILTLHVWGFLRLLSSPAGLRKCSAKTMLALDNDRAGYAVYSLRRGSRAGSFPKQNSWMCSCTLLTKKEKRDAPSRHFSFFGGRVWLHEGCTSYRLTLYILFTFFPLVTSLLRPKRFLLIYMTTRKPTEASLRFFFFLCFVFLVKIIYFLVIIDFFIQCVIILHFQHFWKRIQH